MKNARQNISNTRSLGIAILTKNGWKKLEESDPNKVNNSYSAHSGILRFELSDLSVVYFKLLDKPGEGFTLSELNEPEHKGILLTSDRHIQVVIDGFNVMLGYNGKYTQFLRLSGTNPENFRQLKELPAFLKLAFGGKNTTICNRVRTAYCPMKCMYFENLRCLPMKKAKTS